MSERKAFLFEEATKDFKLEALCRSAAQLGLTLERPKQGGVILLSQLGDDFVATRNDLSRSLQDGVDTPFLLWYSEFEDVFVRIRQNLGVRIIEFGLEGTEREERDALADALVDCFLRKAKAGVGLGMVYDPEGYSEDYNWDDFFVRGEDLRRDAFFGRFVLLLSSSLKGRVRHLSWKPIDDCAISVDLFDSKPE